MTVPISPAATRSKAKDLASCIALGNLWFLRRWYDLEKTHTKSMNYFRRAPADNRFLIATLIASTLLGIALWLVWMCIGRWGTSNGRKLAQCGFLGMVVLSIESIRQYQYYVGLPWNLNFPIFVIEVLLLAGIGLSLSGRDGIVRVTRALTYASIFLLPVLLADFLWFHPGSEPDSAFASEALLPEVRPGAVSPLKPSQRMIWIIFDEFDQHIAFDARPASITLPEMDRLRKQSMVADHAEESAYVTDEAIPSLLAGETFADSKIEGASTVLVRENSSSEWMDLRSRSTVFRRARELAVNSSIVGWHVPYCRLFGSQTFRCLSVSGGVPDAMFLEKETEEFGVLRTAWLLFLLRWQTLTDAFDGDGISREQAVLASFAQRRQLQQFTEIRDRALADAIDKRIELLYVHFPIPHPYAIYDRHLGDVRLSGSTSYVDNLALVDRTIGELRRSLENAGLWDSTSLLISGDHGFRPWLWRSRFNWTPEMEELGLPGQFTTVPFILKVGDDKQNVVYQDSFSSVISGDLILAILGGHVSTAEQASAWLARRDAIKSVPPQ